MSDERKSDWLTVPNAIFVVGFLMTAQGTYLTLAGDTSKEIRDVSERVTDIEDDRERRADTVDGRLARIDVQLAGRGAWMMCQTRWNDAMMRATGVPRSELPCVPDRAD